MNELIVPPVRNHDLIISISKVNLEEDAQGKPHARTVHMCNLEGAQMTETQVEMINSILVNLVRTWGIDIYKSLEHGIVMFDAENPEQAGQPDTATDITTSMDEAANAAKH